MLDYLEKGVFDALDKQYLQSFVFAIYLVSGFTANAPVWFNVVRPTFRTKQILQSMYIVFSLFHFHFHFQIEIIFSIVEAWSFNFRYHKVEGTSTTIPVFSLDKAMAGVSLVGDSDPVMSAVLRGRHVTLGEVKRSVKVIPFFQLPTAFQPELDSCV